MRPAALSTPPPARGRHARGGAAVRLAHPAQAAALRLGLALARAGRAGLPGRRQARQHRRAAGAEEPGRRARAEARRPRARARRAGGAADRLRRAAPVDHAVHRAARVPVLSGRGARSRGASRSRRSSTCSRSSLRFHLERQTGGVSRDIERGSRSIQSLLNYTIYNILPTLVEITMVIVAAVGQVRRLVRGDHLRRARPLHRLHGHASPSGARRFRRAMNEQDSKANTKALDALLNYETVKYFSQRGASSRRATTRTCSASRRRRSSRRPRCRCSTSARA